MDFGLLGPLRVRDGARHVSVSAPRQRVLLAALLLSAGRVVSLDSLAGTLWEGGAPAGARGALHSAVQRLRSTLGPAGASLIETRPPGYLINAEDAGLDIREFSELAARGHAAAQAGTWPEAASLLREALGRWRGEPLEDVPSQVLRNREVPHLADQRLHALAARIDADMHLGRHGEVVAELRQLVAEHPLQEQFHAQLMLSLYRTGQAVRRPGRLPGRTARSGRPARHRPRPRAQAAASAHPGRRQRAPAPRRRRTAQSPTGSAQPVRRPWHPLAGPGQEYVVPRQLPAATRHFAGRDEALKALAGLAAEAAAGSPETVIAVIAGTAGIGKTTLALHFAHQAAGQFPDGQLYVNLRGFDPAGPPVTPGRPSGSSWTRWPCRPPGPGRPGRPGRLVPQPAGRQADAGAAGQRAGRRPGPPAAAGQPRLPGDRDQPQPAHQPGRRRGRVAADPGCAPRRRGARTADPPARARSGSPPTPPPRTS